MELGALQPYSAVLKAVNIHILVNAKERAGADLGAWRSAFSVCRMLCARRECFQESRGGG